jgi:diphosphomevalonate decarboxylase
LCILEIAVSVYGEKALENDFIRKASFLARLGSGSASRSVYGGIVLWGYSPAVKGSSDEYAVEITSQVHPIFKDFKDMVLILDDQEKSVSSSTGHDLMKDNPYSTHRFDLARRNISRLYEILKIGDENEFINIVEYEALSLHALMLTSYPGYLLMKSNTIEAIKKIRGYRNQTNIPVGFTLDAGPNIHLLFPAKYENTVNNFIQTDLIQLCKDGRIISDRVGKGPIQIVNG